MIKTTVSGHPGTLGLGFESWHHYQTRQKEEPFDNRKYYEKIKAAKWGESQKILKMSKLVNF